MKKYLKTLYAFAVILMCSLVMFGCGVKIDKHTVKTGTIETTIPKGTTLVTDNFEAVLKYSDGTTKTIDASDVTFGSIDTTTTGVKDLKVTYEDYSFVVKIKVVESRADVATVTLFNSDIVTAYNANKGTQTNKQEEFTTKNDVYYVGDYNPFHFRINAKGIDGAGNLVDNLTNVRTNVKLEEVTYTGSTASYDLLTDTEVATYVDVNTENTTFDFKETARDKTFRITVSAENYDEAYFDEAPSFNMTVKVIDAYNAYDATDLSVLDNSGKYGWDDKKSDAMLAISNEINGVIIHNDIHVNDSDLPAGLFYTESEAEAIPAGVTSEEIEGTMKDDAGSQLYGRYLKANQEFNFIGNYYQIDFSNVTKAVVQNSTTGVHIDPNYVKGQANSDKAMTSHTSFMRFDPVEGNTTFPEINIKNIAFKGNGKRTERSAESGGLLLLKSKGTKFTADNTIYQDTFIGYMFERFDGFDNNKLTADQDQSNFEILNTKGYNCYNSLLYIWGAKNVLIENSELIGAGGPVMIVDHVGIPDDNILTGEGGFPSTVNVIASTLESYVTGNEPWFITYGANVLVPTIKAMNQAYQVAGQTFLQTKEDIPELINMICVTKSASTEGLSVGRIRSKVTIFENRTDFAEQVNNGDKSYGLYFQDIQAPTNLTDMAMYSCPPNIQDIMASGNLEALAATANYFESNKTGGYIASNNPTAPNGLYYDADYINIYLFNGMGAMFGLYPVDTQA